VDLFGFAPVEGRAVVAAFDGGRMTSEAGAMLLGATNGQLRLIERFAGCFTDHRAADLVEHTVAGLVGQRVFAIALGYEDLIDHDAPPFHGAHPFRSFGPAPSNVPAFQNGVYAVTIEVMLSIWGQNVILSVNLTDNGSTGLK
jgi:hypothetical protein